MGKRAIIIGAGPAGLTAALELLRRTDIQPIVLEASEEIGGISRTIRYKGNRMDIGGHRFFSKSARVMQWWMELMPPDTQTDTPISYQGKTRMVTAPGKGSGQNGVDTLPSVQTDLVMLVRTRKSRIYYLRKFFDYPIRLTAGTLKNLGVKRVVMIGVTYLKSRAKQISPEMNLQDFLINRFGSELYLTFFKSYTEKVWGVPCEQISPEWGAQRIKGLSLTTALKHLLKKSFAIGPKKNDLAQKNTDTSLIERFLYPKLGPGQLWENVAERVSEDGGEVHIGWKVDRIKVSGNTVSCIEAVNAAGERQCFGGEYFFSTMPMQELVRSIAAGGSKIPSNVSEVSEGLQYRDFITVGLLIDRLSVKEPDGGMLKDTWIYIQEPDVLLGRLQIFNNWSPYLVEDPTKIWLGLEYFCYDTDPIWAMKDDDLKAFAIAEVVKIGILEMKDVKDATVIRVPKTYPAYFGSYDRFSELRDWTDQFSNLFLIGRNGMHKYNNQDHSMLTAMTVVDGLVAGSVDKAALWDINTEQEYHEEKK